MKPTLILICGLPGAGKTTLAKKLAKERSAVRFSPDEKMYELGMDFFDEAARDKVEQAMWTEAQELLKKGRSVILEYGFWGRKERDEKRLAARELGAAVELHYLEVPLDELWKRVQARNKTAESNGISLTRQQLENAAGWLQAPTAEELELFD